MSVTVTDAFNGYGTVANWECEQFEFTEECKHCPAEPQHLGRHKWRREWKRKSYGRGFTLLEALSNLKNVS